jgi:hypothetical protein
MTRERFSAAYLVWDRHNGGEATAMRVLADDADEAADLYMERADGCDGYPDELMVRGPDGTAYAVDVTTEYEAVHYVEVAEFIGPIQNHWPEHLGCAAPHVYEAPTDGRAAPGVT